MPEHEFTAEDHVRFGDGLLERKKLRLAAKSYRTALTLDPQHRAARFNLAKILERSNRLDEAEEVLNDSSSEGVPSDRPGLQLIAARIDRRRGRYDDALARLRMLDLGSLKRPLAGEIHHELGLLHDHRNESEFAFQHFSESNRLNALASPDIYEQRNNWRRWLNPITQPWIHSSIAPENTPVFLIGFPRSGTTLLHQILASHPRVEVIDEIPAFHQLESDYAELLADPGDEEVLKLRDRYYAEIGGAAEQGRVLVDKLPLNTLCLPLIQRIFPRARVIFAKRHPCDVCLSCFMQNFDLNPEMANFTSLEDTVEFYVGVMDHWAHVQDRIEFPHHTVQLENVIQDFDREVRELLEFIGVEWDPAVADFHVRAREREISTPSYSQVVRALNTDGVDRWQKYQRWFEPHLARLKPFI